MEQVIPDPPRASDYLEGIDFDEFIGPVLKMDADLRKMGSDMGEEGARAMVDSYYATQETRKGHANRVRSMETEPIELLEWVTKCFLIMEHQAKLALGRYAASKPVGQWLMSLTGIGPVIAAGLMAHIDITRAPTVGHIWSYAGLNPKQRWEKGQKRPWNAELKTLCAFKVGESIVKNQNRPNGRFYGQLFAERKAWEIENNERGDYANQAAEKLERFNIRKTTEAYGHYSGGKLPPAHIHARARRWVVKLFLSHLHEVWFTMHYGLKPAKPYAIEFKGHAHYLPPPNWNRETKTIIYPDEPKKTK